MNASQLASASNDRTVRLWDPASGQPTATLGRPHRPGVLAAITWGPRGITVAAHTELA